MSNLFKVLVLIAAPAFLLSRGAQAQNSTTYAGNGAGGFGGAIGQDSLLFSTDGTTLTGTINVPTTTSGFNDELVIYIDDKAGGFTSTSSLNDNGSDALRGAVSGLASNGTTRATVNFASGFGADYAIALSPKKGQFGALYTLDKTSGFTYGTDGTNGSANLTPTGPNTNTGTFTFSIPLSLIGSPTSFSFLTTYLDGAGGYRSNEAFGNSITDLTNPNNTGNLGQDTGLLGDVNSFSTVPEPSTWMAAALCVLFVGGFYLNRRVGLRMIQAD